MRKVAMQKMLILSLFCIFSESFTKFNFGGPLGAINIVGTNSQLILNAPLVDFTGTLNLKNNSDVAVSNLHAQDSLTFSCGVLNTGLVSLVLSGTFNPSGSDTIILGNGDFMDIKSGSIVQSVNVASGARATILGQPKFSHSILLGDSYSILELGIVTELTQSVVGDGTLSLLDDLSIGKSVQLPSLIQQNGKKISFTTGGVQSVALANTTGGTIEFHGYTKIIAPWTIGSGDDVYTINGNGSILELSEMGRITFNGASLYINNVTIVGLKTLNPLNGSGRIIMSNVILNLAGDFVRSDGSFTFYGGSCKIVSNGSLFIISGTGNEVLIHGAVLNYDQLDGSGKNPLSAEFGAQIIFSTGGKILPSIGLNSDKISINVKGKKRLTRDDIVADYTLLWNVYLTDSSTITVVNDTPLVAKEVIVDGGGYSIYFPKTSGAFLVVEDNVSLILTHVVLRDFYPLAISLGTGSTITFGEGVVLELDSDLKILTTDSPWAFAGNAIIDGKGSLLTIQKSQGITVTGSKTLVLKNMILKTSVSDGFKALVDSATVQLQDVELLLQSSGFNFSQGNLDIISFVKLTGNAETTNDLVDFEFSSKGLMIIQPSAELFVDSGVNLKYNADPTNDLNLFDSKRHFSMAEVGSKLTLNGCALQTTDTGLALDQGTVKIIDKVVFTGTVAASASFDAGSDLAMILTSGANLKMNCPMTYSEYV